MSEGGTDILAAVLEACRRHPDAPALSWNGRTLRYGELEARVRATAGSLAARGMVPGDGVLFSVRPGLDAVCLALGILSVGATVIFADIGAGEAMFRARAHLAGPRWVAAESLLYFASSGPLRPIARSRGLELPPYRSVVPNAQHLYSGPWLPGVPRGAVSVASLAKGGAAPEPFPAGDPSAPALIVFTSGTTADPKAVVHSRLSVGTGLADFARHTQLAEGDRVLTDQLMVGIPALIAGAHWTLPPHGASPLAAPGKYLDLLPETDVLFAVPAALDALLALLEAHPERTPALKTVLIGGAPVLRPLLERVRRQLPDAAIKAIYGMTEILPVAIADGEDKLAFPGPGDYVGQLSRAVDARIVEGELLLSGPGLMLGYLGREPIAELPTGDLARIDGDRLVLTGRSKDMFIRGSTNIYPGLYEPVIAGIRGVQDAALVGVPDAIGDDVVVLVVVPTDAPAALTREHPALDAIRRSLPGLIDAAALPDLVLASPALPLSGRSSKLDRRTLAAQVTGFLA